MTEPLARDPNGNTKRWNVRLHYRAGTNSTARANSHTSKDYDTSANPTVISNDNTPSKFMSSMRSPLLNRGVVLASDDADIRANFYVVPNRHQPTIKNSKAKQKKR
ncbi:hypothetical protein PoHVEF18_008673 [Penicillium ochrochloron]